MTAQSAIPTGPLAAPTRLGRAFHDAPSPGRIHQVPEWLGGEPVVLPNTMPGGLPADAVRQLDAALRHHRAPRRPRAATPGDAPVALGPAGLDPDAITALRNMLASVTDLRGRRGRRFPLPYLLALLIVAIAARQPDPASIGRWIHHAPAALLLALGAPLTRHGRPRRPSRKTVFDALAAHQDTFDQACCAYLGALARRRARQAGDRLRPCLHVDGKTQKGAAPHTSDGKAPMLLAARRDDGTVAAQQPVNVTKTNEISAFRPLLDQLPDTDLHGVVITADQMHTQRAHARYLAGRGAHYVFTVGENQPNLFTALDRLAWRLLAVQAATVDRGHGRIEVRTIRALPAPETVTTLFPHVAQVFLLERYIYDYGGKQLGAVAVLGITSLTPDQAEPEQLLAYVRGHWSIEVLHWIRDVVLGEDDSTLARVSRGMAALRNFIIGMLTLHGITAISEHLHIAALDPYRQPLALLRLLRPDIAVTAT